MTSDNKKDKKSKINISLLVWSIINFVFGSKILGILSFVFTILAAKAEKNKEKTLLKTSMIVNIVATIDFFVSKLVLTLMLMVVLCGIIIVCFGIIDFALLSILMITEGYMGQSYLPSTIFEM